MNRQREVIYGERRAVLEGADLHEQIRAMIDDVVEGYVTAATDGFPEEWDLDALWTALKQLYPVSMTLAEVEEEAGGRDGLTRESLIEDLKADAQAAYDEREAEFGDEVMRELERRVLLSVLDRKWREHLYEMDYLREGIGLRAYSQRDPLVEYQREGFDMFHAMMDGIKEEAVGYLFNLEVQVEEEPEQPAQRSRCPASRSGPALAQAAASAQQGMQQSQPRPSAPRASTRRSSRRTSPTPRRRRTATPRSAAPRTPPPSTTTRTPAPAATPSAPAAPARSTRSATAPRRADRPDHPRQRLTTLADRASAQRRRDRRR